MFLQLRSPQSPQTPSTLQLLTLTTRTPIPGPLDATPPRALLWNVNATTKIKFKRKGGWIRTFKNWSNPHLLKFGYGHPVLQPHYGTHRHRYKRHLSHHCIVWAGIQPLKAQYIQTIVNTKPFNCYTLRGIRTSRFYLLKRKGKESKYTKLKSKIF